MTEKTRLDAAAAESGDGGTPIRPGVRWLTVVSLAALMAFADGFWMISLRGAVGAIERTQGPFASWLRESSAVLPLFMLAALAALKLALRWFGPVLGALLVAFALLRRRDSILRRPTASAHVRSLPVVAVIAISVLGLAGTGPAWFESPGSSLNESVNVSQH